jgi:hypothetical protein
MLFAGFSVQRLRFLDGIIFFLVGNLSGWKNGLSLTTNRFGFSGHRFWISGLVHQVGERIGPRFERVAKVGKPSRFTGCRRGKAGRITYTELMSELGQDLNEWQK